MLKYGPILLALLLALGCSKRKVINELPDARFTAEVRRHAAGLPTAKLEALRKLAAMARDKDRGGHQVRFLLAVATEASDPSDALSQYNKLASDRSGVYPEIAASAAFRSAQVYAARDSYWVRGMLVMVRARCPHGVIWACRSGKWDRAEVRSATEELFQQVHGSSLTYRAVRWLAGRLRFPGGYFVGVLLVTAALHLAQLPLLIAARADTLRERYERRPIRCWLGWVAADLIGFLWIVWPFDVWAYAFAADGGSGALLTVGYAAANFAFLTCKYLVLTEEFRGDSIKADGLFPIVFGPLCYLAFFFLLVLPLLLGLKPSHCLASCLASAIVTLLQCIGLVRWMPDLERSFVIMHKKALGRDHPHMARYPNREAMRCLERRDYGQAEPHCLESLAVLEKDLGKDNPSMAVAMDFMARFYRIRGKPHRAAEYRQRAKALRGGWPTTRP